MSLLAELTVPCGSCPGAQKKCFGFVSPELAGAAEATPIVTTAATTAASARRLRPTGANERAVRMFPSSSAPERFRGLKVEVLPPNARNYTGSLPLPGATVAPHACRPHGAGRRRDAAARRPLLASGRPCRELRVGGGTRGARGAALPDGRRS